jgi:hypothetical protein
MTGVSHWLVFFKCFVTSLVNTSGPEDILGEVLNYDFNFLDNYGPLKLSISVHVCYGSLYILKNWPFFI